MKIKTFSLSKIQRRWAALFFGSWLWFLFAWLAEYPGIVALDTVFMMNRLITNTELNWNSYFYLCELKFLHETLGSIAWMGPFQTLLFSLGLSSFFVFHYQKAYTSNRVTSAVFGLFCIAPITLSYSLLYYVEAKMGVLQCLSWSCLLWSVHIESKKISRWRAFGFVLFFSWAASLRIDSLINLMVVIPLIACRVQWSSRTKLAALGVAALTSYSIVIKAPQSRGQQVTHFTRAILPTINPVGYILSNDHYKGEEALIRRDLEPIFAYDQILPMHKQNPYDILLFYNGYVDAEVAYEIKERFLKRFGMLIYDNPGLYLANRVEMFMHLHGLKKSLIHFEPNYDIQETHTDLANAVDRFSLQKRSKIPWAHSVFNKYFDWFLVNPSSWLQSIFGSNLISLISIGLVATLGYAYPVFWIMAMVSLSRVLLFFFVTPNNHFKYVIEVYFTGWMLLPFAIFIAIQFLKSTAQNSSDTK